MTSKAHGPVLYCGDPHGAFQHILEAAEVLEPSAVVLVGDMEPSKLMGEELAPIASKVWWIPGNHDADSDESHLRVWEGGLAERNFHGKVVLLPDGTRMAGLGGVFRESVWNPSEQPEPNFRSRQEHAKKTPRQDRWAGGHHRKHWGSIYPDEFKKLGGLRADVLVTHEAPGYHPLGFEILDELARALGVKVTVHGHHHDNIDSSARWVLQGFKSFGVGLRGVTAIDLDGNVEVIVPGELDARRSDRTSRS
jgi:predicted phosphodiesterase